MRGRERLGMRGAQNSVETVNAAAAAIVSASQSSRQQQVIAPRKKWWTWFRTHWCFAPQGVGRRIGDADLVPGQSRGESSNAPMSGHLNRPPQLTVPFVAPPSSPASSLLTSEAPSCTQSPAAPLIFSVNSYSPIGPASIFAIGPYAHETQLVSPPVFSTFTTEPSTAPLTPPPEGLHLTNPSSPEVPFAWLLASSFNADCEKSEGSEFHAYQLHPGSPIGQLVLSPNSVRSGTCSPFPDLEFRSRGGGGGGGDLQISEPPRISSPEGIASRRSNYRRARNDGSLLDGHISAAVPTVDSTPMSEDSGRANRRVSFELALAAEEKPTASAEAASQSSRQASPIEADQSAEVDNVPSKVCVDETYHDLPKKVEPPVRLQGSKEFKFDNSDGFAGEHNAGSDWFANEAANVTESGHRKNWPFFPMIEHSAG